MGSRLLTFYLMPWLLFSHGCSSSVNSSEKKSSELIEASSSEKLSHYTFKILQTYPHDETAFCQGLIYDQADRLYEGTGLYGASVLRLVSLHTGTVIREIQLSDQFFGEGITQVNDHLIQLTWLSKTGLVYDRHTFEMIKTFSYDHEGWGLTYDGTHLIVSDGSSMIRFWNPETFETSRKIHITVDDEAWENLNELEYIQGEIWANVLPTDFILRIDPQTGKTRGLIDLTELYKREDQSARPLNCIAYDQANDRVFVTGKLWPHLYSIELVPVVSARISSVERL